MNGIGIVIGIKWGTDAENLLQVTARAQQYQSCYLPSTLVLRESIFQDMQVTS